MKDPDTDLVRRVALRDDRKAFAELVKRHQSGLRNFLRRLTKTNDGRAEELAQEAFVKAYRSIRSFKGTSKFSSWLYRIGYRLFLNDIRREKTTVPIESVAHQVETRAVSRPRSEFSIDLEDALLSLSVEERAVFDLHYKKGFTHEEVADALEIPLGTAKSHLLRGRNQLRNLLKDWRKS